MNKKDYNSYLILGVVVVVVVFLFSFSLFNKDKDAMTQSQSEIQQQGDLLGQEDSKPDEKEEAEKEETTPTISTEFTDEQILTSMVLGFNDEWVNYVNDGATALFNYVQEDSELYNFILVFETAGLTEELLDIQVTNVDVQGDVAYIYDTEKISKVRNGQENVVEYNWVYTARKVDGKWALESMDEPN